MTSYSRSLLCVVSRQYIFALKLKLDNKKTMKSHPVKNCIVRNWRQNCSVGHWSDDLLMTLLAPVWRWLDLIWNTSPTSPIKLHHMILSSHHQSNGARKWAKMKKNFQGWRHQYMDLPLRHHRPVTLYDLISFHYRPLRCYGHYYIGHFWRWRPPKALRGSQGYTGKGPQQRPPRRTQKPHLRRQLFTLLSQIQHSLFCRCTWNSRWHDGKYLFFDKMENVGGSAA